MGDSQQAKTGAPVVAYDKFRWIHLSLTRAMYRGSFAVVKEGRHKASGTPVAIKIVDKKDAVFDPESLEQEVPCTRVLPLGRLCSACVACPGMLALWGSLHDHLSQLQLQTALVFCVGLRCGTIRNV